MARNLHVPIRMCIQCRERLEQKHLIRLQCKEKQVIAFAKNSASDQMKILRELEISPKPTTKARKEQYREHLKRG